jgi:hypothetical protein
MRAQFHSFEEEHFRVVQGSLQYLCAGTIKQGTFVYKIGFARLNFYLLRLTMDR